ncbi:TetR/AcrR family transcriptional regulator [Actinosynnema sp. NPDC053489]|uniref:TetR/AcrR family transcriptional regulator n=1 Tax=Actinosynnema sp. NPDC053489 TaxID=3363916 RepID=UPI0037CA773B
MATDTSSRRPRRADAERNRAAIIEAATEVLAEQGSAVDVREIAQRSGVGMGTLYRHFPTKDDLLGTVLDREFTAWAGAAREAAASTDDPRAALEGFYQHALATQARHRAVVEAYGHNWSGPALDCTRLLYPVLDDLRARAQEAGVLRADATTGDLALLLATLSHTVQLVGDHGARAWKRQLRITLDGLRPAHGTSLPTA